MFRKISRFVASVAILREKYLPEARVNELKVTESGQGVKGDRFCASV
jgi:DNA-binding protein